MKAIVTVIGRDKVGITAAVCALLAQHSINILDISQTVLQEYFTMVMLVDLSARSPRGHTAFYRRKLCSINTRSCRPSR